LTDSGVVLQVLQASGWHLMFVFFGSAQVVCESGTLKHENNSLILCGSFNKKHLCFQQQQVHYIDFLEVVAVQILQQ